MSVSYRAVESLDREVRLLRDQDLPDVLEIERTGYSFPWTESVFRDCFRPDYRFWGVFVVGELAGYAVVAYMADDAHLLNICISGRNRRSGLARHLLRHLVREAATDGMVQVLLEVRVSNQAAAELYLTEGFADIGRRPGYYPSSSGREDARVLSLKVSGTGD
ncbi:ribosomal protein S18-alanine N-acetyltransferase [Marinobacter confluentis]|uniref:[Ribosomal protein bS18]-alanine N-acetyltransferase n=1 Tax=Marinobacter confluentis TaxID=1697557 RepID=A0A4Z1BFU8_9GAMM|nr:ribosomal protein S18-alanine N-acetyltransferase [Marinobacter confluentis]TGN38126.1 ribosomal-protein-alanine N-acetyltransferase [Marinobacter confluentis]